MAQRLIFPSGWKAQNALITKAKNDAKAQALVDAAEAFATKVKEQNAKDLAEAASLVKSVKPVKVEAIKVESKPTEAKPIILKARNKSIDTKSINKTKKRHK